MGCGKTDFKRKILDEHIFLPLSSDGMQVLYKDKTIWLLKGNSHYKASENSFDSSELW